MTGDELAGIAGLLEGEGAFTKEASSRGHIRVLILATSTDLDVLERLRDLMPSSRIHSNGPQLPRRKPAWRWTLGIRAEVVALARSLRPYMGSRRQEQIDALLRHHESHRVVRRRGRRIIHGTRTGYSYGCRCAECR